MNVDHSILLFFQNIRTPFWDKLMSILTYMGQEMIPIFAICLVFWCINKKTGYILGFAFFASGLTLQVTKIIMRIERPFIRWNDIVPVKSAVSGATGYSFPSGHTQGATVVYGTLFLASKNKAVKIITPLLILAVAVSRVYLGVHTPGDVLTAFLLAALLTLLMYKLIPGFYADRRRDKPLCLVMGLFSLLVLAYAILSLIKLGLVYELGADCFKAAGAGVGFALGYFIERRYIDFDTRCKNTGMQILKLLIGVAGALVMKDGFKLILAESAYRDSLRYFAAAMWVLTLYPLIIKRYFSVKDENSNKLENAG